jgi:manganese-dependent ADP-ribose/CDP-alcohol diphosphatase
MKALSQIAAIGSLWTWSVWTNSAQAFHPQRIYHDPSRPNSDAQYPRSDTSVSPFYPRRQSDRTTQQGRGHNRNRNHQRARVQEDADHDDTDKASACPMFAMGLLSDIQYAPIPDGHSYSGTPRFYRHALSTARHAALHFQDCRANVVVQLGDIVDGKCQAEGRGHDAIDDVMEALSVYNHGSIVHIYGNHCLYNMDRRTLAHKLGMSICAEPGDDGELVGYYSQLVPGTNVRLVVLDSYDVTLLQRCPDSSHKQALAVQILQHHNRENYQVGLENSADGLLGLEKRFVAYNGQVGPVQLQWLHDQLSHCREEGERVLILSHQPILPESCSPNCLMWNYHDVLDVLRRYPDVVMASLAGHAHKGGYRRDAVSGIHFRVVEAVLETPPPHHSYALVDVYADRIHVRGFGDCQSAVYWCDHQSILHTQSNDKCSTAPNSWATNGWVPTKH